MPTPLMTRGLATALLLLGAPVVTSAQAARTASQLPADLIVTNARIYTADDSRPLVEAFAVRGNRIVFTGSAREAATLKGATTRVVDAGGRTVIPGMVDAHAHFAGLAQTLRAVDLTGTKSLDEVIARVQAKAATLPKGTWITGRGWDQNAWGTRASPRTTNCRQRCPIIRWYSRAWMVTPTT